MSSFDLTSPVVRELRAARPHAPEALRERVLQSAGREPEARFSLPSWLTVRRVTIHLPLSGSGRPRAPFLCVCCLKPEKVLPLPVAAEFKRLRAISLYARMG